MTGRRILVGLTCLSLLACDPLPTQIIVHVNAEPAVQARTDRLRVRVWGRAPDESGFDDAAFQFETGPVEPGQDAFPWLVDLRPLAGDPSRVWRIEAAAYEGAPPDPEAVDISPNLLSVSRTSASYADGLIQHVYLLLYDACIDGEPCVDPNSTCAVTGRCEPLGEPGFFNPDAGFPDAGRSLDAGRLDAGPECSAEECNGRDDDCDGSTDETFDFDNDVNRCGDCTTECEGLNSVPSCAGGDCRYACLDGYRSCDDGVPGCETPVDSDNCEDCGEVCPSETPICSEGACVATCPAMTEDCGGVCIDTSGTRVDHCGACDRTCEDRDNATAACSAGACTYTCDANFDDCDDDLGVPQSEESNGCEADLRTPETCGTCLTPCSAGACTFAVCSDGSCGMQNADGRGCSLGGCDGTCASGVCDAMCVPDAGPGDAGMDAGPPDAGPPDAGFDAGPPDAGTDAGPDAGPCGPCDVCCGTDCCGPDAFCGPGDTCVPMDAGTDPGDDAGSEDAGNVMMLEAGPSV